MYKNLDCIFPIYAIGKGEIAICLLSKCHIRSHYHKYIGRRKNSTTSNILKLNLCCNKFTTAKLTI